MNRSILGAALAAVVGVGCGGARHAAASDAGTPANSGSTTDGGNQATDAGQSDAGCGDGTSFDPTTRACVPACNATGLLHDQPLESGGELRHDMLYVPPSYRCDGGAWPLLVDFHGTWSGQESDHGEEYYALDGLLAEADAQGFIVARPRSRSSLEGGQNVYRWDQNPGDYARNARFAHDLVSHLEALYRIDPARVYAAGFSSGTGMAAQFFADQPQVFHGYGFVGGGVFPGEAPAAVSVKAPPVPRIYAVSGYRDYLFQDQQALIDLLDANGYPGDHLFRRGSDNGHELYGWHYREMFAWLDRGDRPGPGSLKNGWVAEPVPGSDDLTELGADGTGALVAAGSGGSLYRRENDGGWSLAARIAEGGTSPAWSGICVLDSGEGFAVGQGSVAHTADHGRTWTTDAGIPAFNPGFFDPPMLNAIGCAGSELVAVGYWDAANSANAGASWSKASIQSSFGSFAAQATEVKASAAGTWIAAGYYAYLARSTDGVTFTALAPPAAAQWLMGIAPAPNGSWWVVGEAGTIVASADDGQTWTPQTSSTAEDLYAVSFFDARRGVAVGAHGTAVLTLNGGQTWSDLSTGVDAFLGDVTWLDASTVLAVGGGGTAVRVSVP